MSTTFTFRVVTPESAPVTIDAEFVKLQGLSGEIGIWPSHTPTLALTAAGDVVYRAPKQAAVTIQASAGIIHITETDATLLVSTITSET